jgi:hypothetical protein
MTDPYCQINKMRLQKVASNERLFLVVAYTLTEVVTFRSLGRTKLVTGTPKKGPKVVFAGGRKMLRGILGVVWEMMDNGNKGCVLAFKLRSHEPDPSPLSNRMRNARPSQTARKRYKSV